VAYALLISSFGEMNGIARNDLPFSTMTQTGYALIAISNQNRATGFRQVVTDALNLDAVLVRDGDAALETIASRGLPALLIVDLSLPRVDGFAVIRKLRRDAAIGDTKVIVVAAHDALLDAARELSEPLAISGILPVDVAHGALHDLLDTTFGTHVAAAPSPDPAARPAPTVDADDAIDRAAIDARRRFRMPVSIGYTRSGEQENLTFHVAARGSEPPVVVSDISTFSFLRQVAESEEPLVIPSVHEHPVFADRLARGAQAIRGFAAVPIVTGSANIVAALCLLDTKPLVLTAADIDAFAAFGRSIGKDLEGAATKDSRSPLDVSLEDVKALQHLAATDPLTGLANRRGGEKHIASEIARARRERRPLSCILIDIDRFKLVNDTYGHQAGDQLLRDVSALLRRTVRAYDVLVRWGGEEFLLVLPGVDLDLARILAERVRVAVEMSDTHGIGSFTVSAGVARFDSDYDFAATLRTADQRLYEAKASGRNRVV
jgi:diguanylate cyclase (GGDEF)-like protein